MTARKFADYDNVAYIWEKIKNRFVEKESGKGLSEANYTQTEKAKLAGIEAGAEANVNADWDATTGDAAILNKPANIVQDANYVHTDNNYTSTEKTKLAGIEAQANKTIVDNAMSDSSTNPVQNAIVKGYIDNAIAGVTGIDFQIVASLPATGEKGVIYLVSHSGTAPDVYDEYIWITVSGTGQFEKIGTTQIDLSSYMQFSDMVPLTTAEIDAICV